MDKHSWVFATLEYNHEFEVDVSIKHKTVIHKRLGDRSIVIIASSTYDSVTELKSINRVQMT